ncbi:hypothetical protein HBH98_223400 [Parastagonospora nodorum]|nr:hypothetical protein HBH98_223400 [Parastagonospora nodorum]KAH4359229.1 hypothetical protein HBH97_212700 [Parastagonospora nodorum]KAH4373651.1 hypothetical protein HBH99_224910 [Parastagonospora nodorum]KAH4401174.1 hypothetical protein HBH92_228270 [Parastagonospora nodorum]KAH4412514.1 hypothetical protein HBH93_219400 [Parastagonospora nodorum]
MRILRGSQPQRRSWFKSASLPCDEDSIRLVYAHFIVQFRIQASHVDHNISNQPPELIGLKNVRPRRAATSPPPHSQSLESQLQDPHQPLQNDNLARDPTQWVDAVEHLDPVNVLGQPVDLRSYTSPASSTNLSTQTQSIPSFSRPTHYFPEFPHSPLPSVSGSLEFESSSSAVDHRQPHSPYFELQDMSALGYMMAPSQYGMHHYGSASSYTQNYPPSSQHGYMEHRSSTTAPYDSAYASSPALQQDQRRPDDQTVPPPYQSQPQALSRSSYQQQPPNAMRSGSTSLASNVPGYGYANSNGNNPNQQLGSNASSYAPPQLYPPSTYSVGDYQPLPTMYPPSSTTPAAYPPYGSSPAIPQPPIGDIPPLSPSPGAQSSTVMPRVLNSRPKPQCWEHGCNGRQFSTFSNLLRHQREKSGTASKSYCPRCGAEFTRTTARNGHMAHDKCKPRRPSESSH